MAHGTIQAGCGPTRTISRKKKRSKSKAQENLRSWRNNLGKMCRGGCGRIRTTKNTTVCRSRCRFCMSTYHRIKYINGRWAYFKKYRLAHQARYNLLKIQWRVRNKERMNLERMSRRATLGD